MSFFPPFIEFNPAPVTTGSPIVFTRFASPPSGVMSFSIFSNASAPSTCRVLTSLGGVDLGRPRDSRGQEYTGPGIVLQVSAAVNHSSLFSTSGALGSPFTAGFLVIFVEEFDRTGAFTRSMQGPERVIVRENPTYLAGSDTFGPFNAIIPVSGDFPVQPGFTYRAWVDLHGETRAAGFGGFGGSAANARVVASLMRVSAFYYLVPL
jgi:hypothetical protein